MDLMLLKKKGTVTTLSLPQNSQSRCDLCRMHWTGSVHMSKHLQQTNRVKKHVGRDYSSINTSSNTVAGSQESFGKVTSKTNAPHNLFFPSFMIRLENNVLRAESSLTASCVVSYYVYWSLWTDISKPPNVFSLGPRLESLHIDKNQQRSDSRRLTPTTTSLRHILWDGKFNWKYSGTSSTQGRPDADASSEWEHDTNLLVGRTVSRCL